MPIPFGPQLIGQTEKTLNALLDRFLDGTGLSEPQWVTLRLAEMLEDPVDASGLINALSERAHFPDAADLVDELGTRGLLEAGRLTDAGREVVTRVQATIRTETAPIWAGLPDDDVAATTRTLNEVVQRAHAILDPHSTDRVP